MTNHFDDPLHLDDPGHLEEPDVFDDELAGSPEPARLDELADSEDLVRRAADLVAAGRPMPLSASVMVNRDEVLELLDHATTNLPEEVRAARWLMKEREEHLAKVQREGEDILEAARARAERMVQRTEVVKAAEQNARKIIDAAETDARRMQRECEDFCDKKLASFEIILARITKLVLNGRQKLQATALPREQEEAEQELEDDMGFFDQDQS